MHYLAVAAAFVAAHWTAIAGVIGGLSSLIGTVKNLLDDGKHQSAEKALDKALDVLAFASKYGARGVPYLGRFSVPGLPSRPNGQGAQVINIADAKKDQQ